MKKKFSAAALGGFLSVIGLYVAGLGWGLEPPAEVGAAVAGVLTFLVSLALPDDMEE